VQGVHHSAGKWAFSDQLMPEAEGPDQAAYLVAQREAVDAMLQQVWGCRCMWVWVWVCVLVLVLVQQVGGCANVSVLLKDEWKYVLGG